MGNTVDVYLISGYVVAILMLGIVFLGLIAYITKLHISKETKDAVLEDKYKKIEELSTQIAEMTEEGMELAGRAQSLNAYYEFSSESMKKLISLYSIYKSTGIDNIMKHRYFGDDPVIQHFIKETLNFDKEFAVHIEQYNKTVGDIFENS